MKALFLFAFLFLGFISKAQEIPKNIVLDTSFSKYEKVIPIYENNAKIPEGECLNEIDPNHCFVEFFNNNVRSPEFKSFQWDLCKTRDYDNSVLYFEISIISNELDINTIRNLNGEKYDSYTNEIISLLIKNFNNKCGCKIESNLNDSIKMRIGVAIFGHFRSVHMEAW